MKITHWTARRKARVIREVRAGTLTLEQALSDYDISPEEFAAWEREYDRHGVVGLAVTKRARDAR